ncbi:MAG: hypothetical protein ACRDQ7_15630 [Haloechinothrix sp.]
MSFPRVVGQAGVAAPPAWRRVRVALVFGAGSGGLWARARVTVRWFPYLHHL